MSLYRLFSAIKRLRGGLPGTLLAVDIETSGLDTRQNHILQVGHCLVVNGEVADRQAFFLDWTRNTRRTGVNPAELKETVIRSAAEIRAKGKTYHTDWERLIVEGHDPCTVLRDYAKLILELKATNVPIVTHNGPRFDCEFLSSAFTRYARDLAPDLGQVPYWSDRDRYWFPDNAVIDTGAILKATQIRVEPYPNETLRGFSMRLGRMPRKGVYWSLAFAIPKFGLAQKYQLDESQAHDAGYDAFVTTCLYKELLDLSGVQ